MSTHEQTSSTATVELGRVFTSHGVHTAANASSELAAFLRTILGRHKAGDWGDITQEDREANQAALEEGARLLSSYNFTFEVEGPFGRTKGARLWIITEADRSVTTVLFPEEY